MAKKKRKSPNSPDQINKPTPAAAFSEVTRNERSAQPRPAHPVDSISQVIFIFLLLMVPLAVRAKVLDFTAPRIINPVVDTGLQVGLFAYYKWLLVIVCALIGLGLLLYKVGAEKYRLRPSYLNAPLLVLVLLILGSVMLAEYKSVALFGIYNQRDGSLLLLAYLGLCLAAANTIYKPWFRSGVDIALMVIVAINTIIMLLDFTGLNLMQAGFIRAILAPVELRSNLAGSIGNTMGNVNYISGLAAALFAYFIAGTILYENNKKQLIAAVAALAAFVMVLLSFSSSGFISLVMLSPLFLLVLWRSKDRQRSLIAGGGLLTACLLIFVVLNSMNPNIYGETVGLFLPQATNIQEMERPATPALSPPAPQFQLPQPGWSPGTGRTYIWRETLQLTAERPWLGYGYGTLTWYFPQDEINKVANLQNYNRLITKPHSMYVGVAFGLGIPALLILLILLGLHFYYTGRNLWIRSLDANHTFAMSLLLFFSAFAIQALFNDPVVDAGAVFWILLGVSVSLNMDADQPSPDCNI
ncbi:MAG TPA: O-antigen ligase family protein [Syntrophomonadaceae bacterium]|nr:O-antigen ligase family protein [Syntrophomonadaceae bacterium]